MKSATQMVPFLKQHPAGLLLCLLLIPAGLTRSGALSAQTRIGYVDSQKIRKNCAAVQEAEQKLQEENRTWESELKSMHNELDKLKAALEEQSLLLSEARKRAKQQEIEDAEAEIRTFQNRVWGDNGEYTRKQVSLLKPAYEEIKKAVDTVSEDEGYDIIFDTVQGNIVFAKKEMDITEQVIELLGKQQAGSDSGKRR